MLDPSKPIAQPQEAEPSPLRLSTQLARVPSESEAASPRAAASGEAAPAVPGVPPAPVTAALPAPLATATAGSVPANPQRLPRPLAEVAAATPPITWVSMSAAMLFGVGWIVERRRRRTVEAEHDSRMWTDISTSKSAGPPMSARESLDMLLPDGPSADEAARAVFATAMEESTSRREASLVDLHQLHGKILRRLERGDVLDAVVQLQQHLVDFRFTSPWAFLELRECYRELDRPADWEAARQSFRNRFGQNAPAWDAPSTSHATLLDDRQLSAELAADWPFRESRMVFLRWLLGDPTVRHKCMGPPLLPLGVYRELLTLDAILDDVIRARQRADSGLMGLEVTD